MKRRTVKKVIAICIASATVFSMTGCREESKVTANTEITDTASTEKKLGGITYELSSSWKRDASDRQDTAEYTNSNESYTNFHFKTAYTKENGANQSAMIESYEYQMLKAFPGITNDEKVGFGSYMFNSYSQLDYQTDDGKGKRNVEVYICSDGTRTAYFEFIYGEKDKALDEIRKIMESVKIENMKVKKDTAQPGKVSGEVPLQKVSIPQTENFELYMSKNWEPKRDGYSYADGDLRMSIQVEPVQGTEEEIIELREETITNEKGSPDKKDQIAANGVTIYEYSYESSAVNPVDTNYYVFTDNVNVVQIKIESEKIQEYYPLIKNLVKSITLKTAESKNQTASEENVVTDESSEIRVIEVKPGEEALNEPSDVSDAAEGNEEVVSEVDTVEVIVE